MQQKRSLYNSKNFHLLVGTVVGLGLLGVFMTPAKSGLHSPGPMNTGHEKLACEQCHEASQGSLRQQLQANMKYLLGQRKTPVPIGKKEVSNRHCLDCHDRPEDRHPVFRFLEPRYKKARQELRAHMCNSCHREHSGKRVTTGMQYCRTCHSRLNLKNDPIDIPHARLIKDKDWRSCMGCHDFHGNHRMKTKTTILQMYPEEQVLNYFSGGQSPYSKEKYYKAKKNRLAVKENEI